MNSRSGSEVKFGDCVVFKDDKGNFHAGDLIQLSMNTGFVNVHSGGKVYAVESTEVHKASELWDAYDHDHTAPVVNESELRQDGLTFEEYTANGNDPATYPAQGYAEKPSDGLSKYRAENPNTAKPLKATAPDKASPFDPVGTPPRKSRNR